jgi:hypothetical protein
MHNLQMVPLQSQLPQLAVELQRLLAAVSRSL